MQRDLRLSTIVVTSYPIRNRLAVIKSAAVKALSELTVAANRSLGGEIRLLTLKVPHEGLPLLEHVHAGRFIMLRCDESEPYRFRRPFSFASVDVEAGSFDIYFKVVGEQTRRLADSTPGTQLSGVLPLGNAFTMPPPGTPTVLVAGGVGVAPLLLMARELAAAKRPRPRLYFGGNTSGDLTLDYVSKLPVEVHPATDDGSFGFHGNIVETVASEGVAEDTRVYACGPVPMLKALAEMLPQAVHVEASLEEVMACGIGACYGCAVRTDGLGYESMKLVCRDGPVFDLRRVRFG